MTLSLIGGGIKKRLLSLPQIFIMSLMLCQVASINREGQQ